MGEDGLWTPLDATFCASKECVEDYLKVAEAVGTGLEYGTEPTMEVTGALIQDQWLHRHGDMESAEARATKARMMNAFYPDDQAWRDSVLDIAQEVVGAVLQESP